MNSAARWMIRAGIVLAAVAGAASPTSAQCTDSVLFGNRNVSSAVALNIDDPAAYLLTYVYQDPSMNQGPLTLRDLLLSGNAGDPTDFGITRYEVRTAVMLFADWAGAYGANFDVQMQGCPLDFDGSARGGNQTGTIDEESRIGRVQQVLALGDSKGVTIYVLTSTNGNFFNLDEAAVADGLQPRSSLAPQVTELSTSSSTVNLRLSWQAPVVLSTQDSLPASSIARELVRDYTIFERRYRDLSGYGHCDLRNPLSEQMVSDLDGNPADTVATVSLVKEESICSVLQVGAGLGSSQGTVARVLGVPSRWILLSPNLAEPTGPGKGRGKGLERAPGQNR